MDTKNMFTPAPTKQSFHLHIDAPSAHWACAYAGVVQSAKEMGKGNPNFSVSFEPNDAVSARIAEYFSAKPKEYESPLLPSTEDHCAELDDFHQRQLAVEYKKIHGIEMDVDPTRAAPRLPYPLLAQTAMLLEFSIVSRGQYWFPRPAPKRLAKFAEFNGVAETGEYADMLHYFIQGRIDTMPERSPKKDGTPRPKPSPKILLLSDLDEDEQIDAVCSGMWGIALHPYSPLMPVLRGIYRGYDMLTDTSPILNVVPEELPELPDRRTIMFSPVIQVLKSTTPGRLHASGRVWENRQKVGQSIQQYYKKFPRDKSQELF